MYAQPEGALLARCDRHADHMGMHQLAQSWGTALLNGLLVLIVHLGGIPTAMDLLSAQVIDIMVDALAPMQLWVERAEITTA
jgi:hypothetical protein